MYFAPTEDENRGSAASCIAGIAVAQQEIGLPEAAAITIARALDLAREVKSDDYRSRALKTISVEQARLGDFDGSRRTLDEIIRESYRRSAQGEIATLQARAGLALDAIRTAEGALTERGDLFGELAKVFSDNNDRDSLMGLLESMKRLLEPCAHELNSAYQVCLLLAKLYPGHLSAITEAVVRAEHG